MFAAVFDTKEAFKNYKNIFYEKLKIRIFAKGLVHGFRQILEISLTFNFLAKYTKKKYRTTF